MGTSLPSGEPNPLWLDFINEEVMSVEVEVREGTTQVETPRAIKELTLADRTVRSQHIAREWYSDDAQSLHHCTTA